MQLRPHAVFCDMVKQGPVNRTGDTGWQCLFRALALALSLPSRETAGVPGVRAEGVEVMGATSFGIGCAEVNKPGVYTLITSFLD